MANYCHFGFLITSYLTQIAPLSNTCDWIYFNLAGKRAKLQISVS